MLLFPLSLSSFSLYYYSYILTFSTFSTTKQKPNPSFPFFLFSHFFRSTKKPKEMIQELFGGSGVGIIGGEGSKLSTPPCGGGGGGGSGRGGERFPDHGSPSPSPSPTPSPSPSSSAAAAAAAAAESLRCPRCDSSNTKFCYYNNYNLTQPRHFCKTCRRYWTKGGALRNVPIGGGCRKNKTTIITAAVAKSANKFKAAPPPPDARAGLFNGFEPADSAPLPSNPIMWATSQNSHFLSLLRANQTLNPSHLSMKEEGPIFGSDNLGPAHFPSMGPSNPFYRNQTLTSQGILHGDAQSNGLQLQELYHRLRLSSSSSNCYPEQNMASATSSSSTSAAILESAPVAAPDQMGFWNSNISWPSDLSTANGAYP